MAPTWTVKKFLIKGLKFIGITSLSVALLILLLILVIQIPFVQQAIVTRVVQTLQEKLGTPVRLGRIRISFPKEVVLEGIYLEDQAGDTLLYTGRLEIDLALTSLINHQININALRLIDAKAFIARAQHDQVFNFDFIPKAFSSPTSDSIQTSTTPWGFTIGYFETTNSRFYYQDSLVGNYVDLELGVLAVSVDSLDLNIPTIGIQRIDLSSAKLNVTQTAISNTDTSSSQPPAPFALMLSELSIRAVRVNYRHEITGQWLRLDVGDMNLHVNRVDLSHRNIDLDQFTLLNTFISYQKSSSKTGTQGEPDTDSSAVAKNNGIEPAWNISLNKFTALNNSVQYYDFTVPTQQTGLDANHLWLTRLNGEATNLAIHGNDLAGNIGYLSFRDKSGFQLNAFRTAFAVTDSSTYLHDFTLTTPHSTITLQADGHYKSLATLRSNLADAAIDIRIDSSTISAKDFYFLIPHVMDSLPVSIQKDQKITFDADVSGSVPHLTINRLSVAGLSNTTIVANGTITGLPDYNGSLNLNLDHFYTTKRDLVGLLPQWDSMSPINLPDWINLSGGIQGNINNPILKAWMTSDVGDLALTANLNHLFDSIVSTYQAELKVDDLELGKLIRQDSTIGKISLKASASGSGFTIEQVNAQIDVLVQRLEYKGYTYKDVRLKGSVDQQVFTGDASMEDKNLSFAIHGGLDYNKEIRGYTFTGRLNQADFHALNLTDRLLKARGTIDLNLSTTDFRAINGTVDVRDVAIYNGEALYRVDSLLFASFDGEGKTKITIRSDILSGDFSGTINIFSVGEALSQHIRYYTKSSNEADDVNRKPQNFSFKLQLKNTDLLTEILLPKLEPFAPGEIKGEFRSDEHVLDLRFNIANFRYGTAGVDSMHFKVNSDKTSMNYSLGLNKIYFDTLSMESLQIQGDLSNEGVSTRIVILDSLQREKYVIGGIFKSIDQGTQFHLLPDALILNRNAWETSPDNALRFTSEGVQPHNFFIAHNEEKISVVNDNQSKACTVLFSNLDLRSITSLTEGIILADGTLNGTLYYTPSSIQSNIKVRNLEIAGTSWGNLSVDLNQKPAERYQLDLRLTGKNANLVGKGIYQADSVAPTIQASVDIADLDLALVQPFTRNQIKEMSGQLYGQLEITNQGDNRKIAGTLGFRKAELKPAYVNSTFLLKDEKIIFTKEGMVFKDFKIRDESNNLATLKGTIETASEKNFNLNLTLTAKDFQILNTTDADNSLYYGKLGINTTTRISGNFSHPQIQMNIGLQDESNLTYIIPQSEKGALEQKGIVVFVNKAANADPLLASIQPSDTVSSDFRGIDLTANIELDDQETFSIVVDPISGDKLTVKGNSTLTLDMDQSGGLLLSGRYEITEGTYDLSFYKLVKRKFALQKGSTIVWTGQPLDATLDINAIFEVEASPLELLSNQLSTTNPQELNTYRQRLPFLVYLKIKGNLSTPEISFQLDMPADQRNAFGGAVYARIKDINTRESDLNKQIFALLILKRFISDNPLESQSGDLANSARQSVSRLLSEQLNRLTENIKGIDLTFDVKSYEDYSTGQAQGQTKLQLGVSKQLLDDRLVVKVSGNVDIEGNNTQQNSLTQFIGDLALEYKITPDGRLRITGFRNSNFDLIDGELIETGAGLIYIKDYDTLRELFNANGKDK